MAVIRSVKLLPLLLITLVLAACIGGDSWPEFSVSGEVTDAAGEPLAGVLVTAQGRVNVTYETHDDGFYLLTGLRGPTEIWASKEHWAFLPLKKTLKNAGTVDFTGAPGAALAGTITVEHSFPRSLVDSPPSEGPVRAQRRLPLADSSGADVLDHEPEELIITFADGVSAERQLEILAELGFEVLDHLAILNAYLVRPPADLERGKQAALVFPEISSAEPNATISVLSTVHPNDEFYAQQWHYPLIRLPQAWSVTRGSRSIRIAVVDTGIKADHPDLASKLDHKYGYNFVQGNGDFNDTYGHGTHVAGTIGAVTNNGLGVAGVMWDVEILPVKVMELGRGGDAWTLAQGLLYAAGLLDNPRNPYPADVINVSLGAETNKQMSPVQNAIERILRETDCIVVAAGGNRGTVHYPAAYPGVVAVAAVDYNYPHMPKRAPYSSQGPELTVAAPGGNVQADTDGSGQVDGVLSTSVKDAGYQYMDGTSMAAPHVSGVIGLMLAAGIPPQRVVDVLKATSMPLGPKEFSEDYGYGLINAYWAVNGVETMRLIVGRREGAEITVVAETSLPARGGYFELGGIYPDEYQVFAWVDVQPGTDTLEPGDYFNESELIRLEPGRSYTVRGTVRELGLELDPPLEPLQVVLLNYRVGSR